MHTSEAHTTGPVFVVPCAADKAPQATTARELYTSASFRNVLAVAELMASEDGGRVLILSAEHGLLPLDALVAPYDTKMGQRGCVTTEDIATTAQLAGVDYGTEVYALLPNTYFTALAAALDTLDVYPQDVYEAATRGIGDQRGVVASVRRAYAA